MRAAIYARKSTDQPGDGTTRSVTRQAEAAEKFIESKGWTLGETYTDDGVSGALFASRQAFQEMLKAAQAAKFDHLVVFDIDRFGRHAMKTMTALSQLADSGVTVWDCASGTPVDVDTFEGEMMTFLKARFAQQYRESVRKHVRAAFKSRVAAGYTVMGAPYGFKNVGEPGQRRRVVNPETAPVVKEIFERYAKGEGFKAIAHDMNRRGVRPPRPRKKPAGWEISSVRAILLNPIYAGRGTFGKTQKAYGRELPRGERDKEKGQIKVPEQKWVHFETEAIVSPVLFDKVQSRFRSRKGKKSAKHVRYLLSGILQCMCGAGFEVVHGYYRCSAARRKGPSVCKSKLRFPVQETDDAILDEVEHSALSPEFLDMLAGEATHSSPPNTSKLKQEIRRLTDAIAAGGDLPSLVETLREREAALRVAEAEAKKPRPTSNGDLRKALETWADGWRELLRKDVPSGRRVIQELIETPLEIENEPPPDYLVRWLSRWKPESASTLMVALRGIEPRFDG